MTDFDKDIEAVGGIAVVPTILDVICRATGMGFAVVARVTEGRWIACSVRDSIAFGLKPGGELKVETTICHEIRQHHQPVVIDEAAADEIYHSHPTPALYGFQSYISVPIILPDGTFFGTLCSIDPRPARVNTPEIIGMFRMFAELIAFHLDANERLAASEAKLQEERETAELREQFIAVLGHDLRSPLSAISSGTMLLQRMPLSERAASVVELMQESASRMLGLIENILDFARGRLGGGFSLDRNADEPLEHVLKQVIAEYRTSTPARGIDVQLSLAEPVHCDRRRIAQLFSNLLGNALTYGQKDTPVRVKAVSDKNHFELSVANAGTPIPAAKQHRLFQPFVRGESLSNRQGLGLGLYIASEIAQAHGGTLKVISTPEETCFTLHMPAEADISAHPGQNKRSEARSMESIS